MIRFAFQKENWQRKASCLPNMVKLSVSAVRIWVLVNKLRFLHCIHWIYCEQELNFYYIKPLKSGNLSVTVVSTTFLMHTGSLNMGGIAAKFQTNDIGLMEQWLLEEKEKLAWALFSLNTK